MATKSLCLQDTTTLQPVTMVTAINTPPYYNYYNCWMCSSTPKHVTDRTEKHHSEVRHDQENLGHNPANETTHKLQHMKSPVAMNKHTISYLHEMSVGIIYFPLWKPKQMKKRENAVALARAGVLS